MAAEARPRTGTIGEMYRAIWRVTGRQQLVLIGLSVTVAALAAAPLKFQQLVINSLVAHGDIGRVGWLCAGLLGIVLLSAALKFALNFRLSVLGESVVLLLRERLYANYVTDAGTGAPDVPKRGTLVTMLAAEAESVGAFAGAAIAEPLMQVGHAGQRDRVHSGEPALARRAGARHRRAAGGDRRGHPAADQPPRAAARAGAPRRLGPGLRE
jgi:ABC-type multidrug transport system fused ATPase/permease subunit